MIRFLRSDVAVVHVTAHRDGLTKELTGDAILTLVMTGLDDRGVSEYERSAERVI
jgi:hypothetical protein